VTTSHLAIKPARKLANMLTVAIVSQKGGVGKTTLAVHLADAASAAGLVPLIIDMDPQATAHTWGQWRKGESPEVIAASAANLAVTLQGAREAGAEFVVIDTPPNADGTARAAVKVADLVLIPVRPRAFDLHAIATTAALVDGATLIPARVIFNAMPSRALRLLAEATKQVVRMGLAVCPHAISDRGAFYHAPDAGKVAREIEPAGKAAAEIAAIWDWLATFTSRPSSQQDGKMANHQASRQGARR
jgi:chromosome partitioning protein